jgi:hypothetical protein
MGLLRILHPDGRQCQELAKVVVARMEAEKRTKT